MVLQIIGVSNKTDRKHISIKSKIDSIEDNKDKIVLNPRTDSEHVFFKDYFKTLKIYLIKNGNKTKLVNYSKK